MASQSHCVRVMLLRQCMVGRCLSQCCLIVNAKYVAVLPAMIMLLMRLVISCSQIPGQHWACWLSYVMFAEEQMDRSSRRAESGKRDTHVE